MRRVHAAAVAAAALTLALAPAQVGAATASQRAVQQINWVRAAQHLPPLRVSRSLRRSSRRYGRWMVHHNYFGHLSRVRASRSFHEAAVAKGQRLTCARCRCSRDPGTSHATYRAA